MMRIKEAVQRRRLIQEMNDEWNAHEEENADAPSPIGRTLPITPCEDDAESTNSTKNELALQQFAQSLNAKMNPLQRRALRITWKRLSEAPRTSGRGTINIMEKVFEKMVEQCPDVMPIFYRSAFLSCVEDKKRSRQAHPGRTIATIRDHAHLLVDFIEDILCMMFETPLQHTPLDPYSIARFHLRLEPLGFRRCLWNLFGELFAEVMFSQECVRAYPHAASAWSMLGVALSDSFHAASKRPKISTVSLQDTNSITGRSSKLLHADEHRLNSDCSLASETASCNATLMTMRNVALAACTTGSCISALASVANRRQSIPLEQLHNTSPPPRLPPHCARSVGYNAENMHQIADTYRAQSRCAFDDDAPVTIV